MVGIAPIRFAIEGTPIYRGRHSTTFLVGTEGIEPSASVLSGQRSTTELCAHQKSGIKLYYLSTPL